MSPTLYIVGGCNGSGKTTASDTILPFYLNCKTFVNADVIAAQLSPKAPELVSLEAGRLMLKRIKALIKARIDFAIESTLSGRIYAGIIQHCRKSGYQVVMIYFWLGNSDLAIERIKIRVRQGGHFIADEVVRRRYDRSVRNLVNTYLSLCNYWLVIDNSGLLPEIVSEGNRDTAPLVFNEYLWNNILFANER